MRDVWLLAASRAYLCHQVCAASAKPNHQPNVATVVVWRHASAVNGSVAELLHEDLYGKLNTLPK
jgi:hypothetical protein